MSAIKNRGFSSMSPEKRRMIAGLAGRAAHALGKAHKWTSEEARKAGIIGGRIPKTYHRVDMSENSLRVQVIRCLQDFLIKHPGKAVSFSQLSKDLGASRQYIRVLYHQLKKDYPVPPVGKRGKVLKRSKYP